MYGNQPGASAPPQEPPRPVVQAEAVNTRPVYDYNPNTFPNSAAPGQQGVHYPGDAPYQRAPAAPAPYAAPYPPVQQQVQPYGAPAPYYQGNQAPVPQQAPQPYYVAPYPQVQPHYGSGVAPAPMSPGLEPPYPAQAAYPAGNPHLHVVATPTGVQTAHVVIPFVLMLIIGLIVLIAGIAARATPMIPIGVLILILAPILLWLSLRSLHTYKVFFDGQSGMVTVEATPVFFSRLPQIMQWHVSQIEQFACYPKLPAGRAPPRKQRAGIVYVHLMNIAHGVAVFRGRAMNATDFLRDVTEQLTYLRQKTGMMMPVPQTMPNAGMQYQ